MFKIELGKEGKDKITGVKGIIVARAEHLFGCNTYGVAPQALDNGKRLDTEWFDEGRIEVIGNGIEKEAVSVEEPGCDYRDHP